MSVFIYFSGRCAVNYMVYVIRFTLRRLAVRKKNNHVQDTHTRVLVTGSHTFTCLHTCITTTIQQDTLTAQARNVHVEHLILFLYEKLLKVCYEYVHTYIYTYLCIYCTACVYIYTCGYMYMFNYLLLFLFLFQQYTYLELQLQFFQES